jgi:transcriptional regulator with XRE-family HTH domain
MMGIKDWLNEKFHDWETAQGRSQSYFAFARYLGVSQTALAGWISGTGEPTDEDLAVIAAKLGPGVYSAAGMRLPDSQVERLAAAFPGLPGGLRERLTAAVVAADAAIRERGLPPDSVEAKRLTVEVLAKNGIKLTN